MFVSLFGNMSVIDDRISNPGRGLHRQSNLEVAMILVEVEPWGRRPVLAHGAMYFGPARSAIFITVSFK